MTGLGRLFWKKPSVLVLGSDGMLGAELFERLSGMALRGDISYAYGMGRPELEAGRVLERHGLGDFMRTSRKFDVCVNCVAMTDTAAAENSQDGRDLSYRLNARLPGFLAESCAYWNVRLVHISTDYVFGRSLAGGNCRPYGADDPFSPKNVYGTHKLLGEEYARRVFAEAGKERLFACLRTSWLYGRANSKSFVHKLLKNAVKAARDGKESVDVTSNEYSLPTSVKFLCDAIINDFVREWYPGVFHAVPDGKPVSRADWAKAILEKFSHCVNVSESDAVAAKILSGSFVNPIERKGMLNPEWSVLSPNSNFGKEDVPDRIECLDEFVKAEAQGIYEWALRQA